MAVTAPLLAAAVASMMLAPGERPAPRCPGEGMIQTRSDPALLLRPQDRRGTAGAQTLGSMPPANLELAVIRSVNGCAVSTVVRENIQGDGRFAKPR